MNSINSVFSNYEQEAQIQHLSESNFNFEEINTQILLYICISVNQDENRNSYIEEQENLKPIQYILDYQQDYLNRKEMAQLLFKKEYLEYNLNQDHYLQKILKKVIEDMFCQLHISLIFQQGCTSGIQILEALNRISQSFYDETLKKIEQNRITYFNIVSSDFQMKTKLQLEYSQLLQSFTIIFEPYHDQQKVEQFYNQINLNLLILQNQYFLPLKSTEQLGIITSEIQNLYKYFLKQKLIQFKPNIIILGLEINDLFEIDSFYLKKFIQQLKKISQNQLVIIPFRKNNFNLEKYWKTIINCINANNDQNYRKKNRQVRTYKAIKYQDYHYWMKYFISTQKEKEFYERQLQSLITLQKFDKQICNDQINEGVLQFPILNTKNMIEFVIFEDQQNKQQIVFDNQTKYFLSYFEKAQQYFVTISIVKNQQLYFGEFDILELESNKEGDNKKIKLKNIQYFLYNPYSSYLLDLQKFYQFDIHINELNQYIGTVMIYDFKSNQNNVQKYCIQDNYKITSHIQGFTVVKLSDTSFSLLSGCQDANLYQQLGIKLDLQEQNRLKLVLYQKQDNNLPKGYNCPLILSLNQNNNQNVQSNRFLYFESQTNYFAAPLLPQIYEIDFYLNQEKPSCQSSKIQNVSNIQLIQKYSKLFRSDQINIKYSGLNQNVIAFDLIILEKSLSRQMQIDLNNNNKDFMLQKNVLSNYLHFQIKCQTQDSMKKLLVDLKIQSMLMYQENKLSQKCLYYNWLEDLQYQDIFLYKPQQNKYLLYYRQNNKSGQYLSKNFSFYCNDKIENLMPFDEVVINDEHNSIIWVVRKYHDNQPYIIIYNCHYISLQDVKDDDISASVKVKIEKVFEIQIDLQEFNLIGLEIDTINNMLFIFASTFICHIPVQNMMHQNQNFRNKYIFQTDQNNLCRIQYTKLNIYLNNPVVILDLNENILAFFYQYCIQKCLDEEKKLYQIEVNGKTWLKNKSNPQQTDNQGIKQNSNFNFDEEELSSTNKNLIRFTFNYKSQYELLFAKLISILNKGKFLEMLIIFEEEHKEIYAVQFQLYLYSNQIIHIRKFKLNSQHQNLQILTGISNNKFETLLFYENSSQFIKSDHIYQMLLNQGEVCQDDEQMEVFDLDKILHNIDKMKIN